MDRIRDSFINNIYRIFHCFNLKKYEKYERKMLSTMRNKKHKQKLCCLIKLKQNHRNNTRKNNKF